MKNVVEIRWSHSHKGAILKHCFPPLQHPTWLTMTNTWKCQWCGSIRIRIRIRIQIRDPEISIWIQIRIQFNQKVAPTTVLVWKDNMYEYICILLLFYLLAVNAWYQLVFFTCCGRRTGQCMGGRDVTLLSDWMELASSGLKTKSGNIRASYSVLEQTWFASLVPWRRRAVPRAPVTKLIWWTM